MDPRTVPLPPSPRATKSKKTFHRDPIVRLNVRGIRYEVSRDTLTRYKGSFLASLVHAWHAETCNDEMFIFRDGHMFAYVLDYLRSGRVHLPSSIPRTAMKAELDFFQIPADMNQISEDKDYFTIERLHREIKEQKTAVQEKKMELAAIVESYRLAYKCSESILNDGNKTITTPFLTWGIDRKLLNECLHSRGLDAYGYQIEESGARVSLRPIPEKGALDRSFRFCVPGCEATPFTVTPEKATPPPPPPVATVMKRRIVRVRRK